MAVVQLFPQGKPGDEQRLAEFGLSSSDFHTAFSPGLSRAANRSAQPHTPFGLPGWGSPMPSVKESPSATYLR